MTTAEITVRARRPGDGEELARSWLDAGRYYAELAPETFQIPETDGLVEHLELGSAPGDEPDTLRVVAAATGRIERPLDSARYQLQRQFSETRLMVDVVVVDEAFRRQGVGARLMAALENWGRERGATVALLDTYPESALSLPFFQERMGYRRRSVRLIKQL